MPHFCRFIFLNFDEIMQLASFTGLGGINFILSWFGTVGSDIISHHQNSFSTSTSSTGSIIIDNRASIEDNSTDTILRTSPTRPTRKTITLPAFMNSLSIYSLVLFLVIGYGSIRLNTNFVPFYQQGVEDIFVEKLISFGCVTEQDNVAAEGQLDYYLDLTRELAGSGNKIILWSEGIITEDMPIEKIDLIRNISITNNVIIGFTFIVDNTETIYNKQV